MKLQDIGLDRALVYRSRLLRHSGRDGPAAMAVEVRRPAELCPDPHLLGRAAVVYTGFTETPAYAAAICAVGACWGLVERLFPEPDLGHGRVAARLWDVRTERWEEGELDSRLLATSPALASRNL